MDEEMEQGEVENPEKMDDNEDGEQEKIVDLGKIKNQKKLTKKKAKKEVYLPGKPLEEGEELVCDESAYLLLRDVQTGAPCLSFDIIEDELGENREDFPLTCFIVAGTQAFCNKENNIIVMKLSNLHKTQENKDGSEDESSSESDDDSENGGKTPRLDYASIAHFGCVNRIRTKTLNNTVYAASWSEMGRVNIWDLQKQIRAVTSMKHLVKYRQDNEILESKPVFTFSGHVSEGFALDWSPTQPGVLATGDCKKNIHLWRPTESSWNVNQTPLIGHTASVEDLQWSPNEPEVLASCSVDRTIRIWDTRAAPKLACMISVVDSHESDVNVINWNKNEPFIVSGGEEGWVRVWDLRQIKNGRPVATFKHHTGAVSTIEWHATEPTIFASGGEDNQIALWDLSMEHDSERESEEITGLPPQLLFIHQGQLEIKELHWHKQIPGLVISTASNGFNVFKTINV